MMLRKAIVKVCYAILCCTCLGTGYAQSSCNLSEQDIKELLQLHKEALATIPDSLPLADEIRRTTPESLTRRPLNCVVLGTIRILHAPSSLSIFVLDKQRKLNRWEMCGVSKGSAWTKVAVEYIKGYALTPASELNLFHGRTAFSEEERRMFQELRLENLPPAVSIRIEPPK